MSKFTQDQLESGKYVVVNRDGEPALVLNRCEKEEGYSDEIGNDEYNDLFLMYNKTYSDLRDYKNFKSKGCPSLDIIKVYKITQMSDALSNPQWQTLVWEEDADQRVQQEVKELEDKIDNYEYHIGRCKDKIEELKILL